MKKLIVFLTMLLLIGSLGCQKEENQVKTPPLQKVKPYTAYIYQTTKAYAEPNESKPLAGLTEGRIITVFEQQGDWSKIAYYTYDKPGNNVGWVHDNTYTNEGKYMTLIDGQIKDVKLVYDNIPPKGKTVKFKIEKNTPVFITAKSGNGWVQGIIPGGMNVFLQEKNISYTGPAVK